MPNKGKKKNNKIENLTQKIVEILRKDNSKTYNYKELAFKLMIQVVETRLQRN